MLNKKVKAIYPGSFDPMTNGHLDILDRALALFDDIVILVASNGSKNPLFSASERIEIIQEIVQELIDTGRIPTGKKVTVQGWDGLIMDYARQNKITAVIRGLRAASDFEYEFMMANMNKSLNSEIETVFLMTGKDFFFISSSIVKDLQRYQGDISPYVPTPVVRRLKNKMKPI